MKYLQYLCQFLMDMTVLEKLIKSKNQKLLQRSFKSEKNKFAKFLLTLRITYWFLRTIINWLFVLKMGKPLSTL